MTTSCAIPYIVGAYRHVLAPPGQRAGEAWYINDHCFLTDAAGMLHWFGITNPYPADGRLYGPGSHRHIGHATARHPCGPWTAQPHAFALPEGTGENIGAPCVVRQGDGYVMLTGYNEGFTLAGSADLCTWQWLEAPVIDLGTGTRDPCVLRLEDGSYLLYAAAGHAGQGAVVLAASDDLRAWHPRDPALVSDVPGAWGPLESPCVIRHDDHYYLFVNHSHRQYAETLVFASADPTRFDWQAPLCTLFAHAAEVLSWQGRTYISHCGIEDRHWDDTGAPYGLWLAELGWR